MNLQIGDKVLFLLGAGNPRLEFNQADLFLNHEDRRKEGTVKSFHWKYNEVYVSVVYIDDKKREMETCVPLQLTTTKNFFENFLKRA